jgi:hypothetical protein
LETNEVAEDALARQYTYGEVTEASDGTCINQ